MSAIQGATGLIGTAIGVAALGLALGFVVKAARGDLFDGRDRRKSSRNPRRNVGFDFGTNMTGTTGRKRNSGSQNIFDLGLTQRPARRKTIKNEFGSDFNIFAV